MKNKSVLITCGPTWIPIDDMRIIANRSSGKLGQQMAKDFRARGAKVTLLEGPVEKPLRSKKIRIKKFVFYDDLLKLVRKEMRSSYSVVVHAAAVSDYKLERPYISKLRSDIKRLKLPLVPTQKIINLFKKYDPSVLLVGFKLESDIRDRALAAKTKKLFQEAKCGLVVVNSLKNDRYQGYVIDETAVLAHAKSREGIIKKIITEVQKNL